MTTEDKIIQTADYFVVEELTLRELEETVLEFLDAGFSPCGSLVYCSTAAGYTFLQPMYRPEIRERSIGAPHRPSESL